MLDIRVLAILVALACFTNQSALHDPEDDYCFEEDEHPYLYGGTKTAYYFSHGLIKNTSIPNCKPVQIWMLLRHGTRNPSIDEIKGMKNRLPELQSDIVENHKRGRGTLCEEDLHKLRDWEIDPTLSKDEKKYLTKQGEMDLRSLGKRFKRYFPDLFQKNSDDLDMNKYIFKSTNTQRTVDSMEQFIYKAFRDTSEANTEVIPPENDTLLEVYKICKDEKNHPEVTAFLNGPEYNRLIRKVSQRLGFEDDLSLDLITDAYTACIFERAWYLDKHSPWCAVFTEDELKVLEYKQDLYYYYRASYGEKLNGQIGCVTLGDMFNHFTKLENGNSEELQGIFYFTHSTMLQILLSSMGIAKDSTPLTASNFRTLKDNRKWRTSYLAPFAANLAAVFYECDSSNKVALYLNEKPVHYEGCEMGVCDWEYLKKKLGPIINNCNLDFCKK